MCGSTWQVDTEPEAGTLAEDAACAKAPNEGQAELEELWVGWPGWNITKLPCISYLAVIYPSLPP